MNAHTKKELDRRAAIIEKQSVKAVKTQGVIARVAQLRIIHHQARAIRLLLRETQ